MIWMHASWIVNGICTIFHVLGGFCAMQGWRSWFWVHACVSNWNWWVQLGIVLDVWAISCLRCCENPCFGIACLRILVGLNPFLLKPRMWNFMNPPWEIVDPFLPWSALLMCLNKVHGLFGWEFWQVWYTNSLENTWSLPPKLPRSTEHDPQSTEGLRLLGHVFGKATDNIHRRPLVNQWCNFGPPKLSINLPKDQGPQLFSGKGAEGILSKSRSTEGMIPSRKDVEEILSRSRCTEEDCALRKSNQGDPRRSLDEPRPPFD